MKKILAIDDQKDNLTTIKAVIQNQLDNCEVITASSGKDGIAIAKEEQPDTILLDIVMPVMDGYEVCQRLKKSKQTKHIPIILITAIKTDSENKVKGLTMGADAFLSKPIDPVELSAQIKVMLRIKEAEDQLRADKKLLEEQVASKTKKLTENERQFRFIAENTSDNIGITTFDLKAKYLYVSPSINQVLGYKEEDLLGKSFFDFVHPEDKKALFSLLKEYVNQKIKKIFGSKELPTSKTIEFRFKDKAGDWLHIQSALNIVDNKILAVSRDITKQKQAAESLRKSQEKYKALYENAPIPYQSLNEDGNFRDVNPAWLESLGYNRKEVIGKYYKDFLHPDWKPHFEKNFPEFKKRGYVSDVQFKIRHKKGHYLDITFEGCIGHHPDGSFKQTYCVFKDITEQKKVEQTLLESEERYQSFIRHSIEGIYRMEMKEPMDISLPIKEQIDYINQNAYYAECNDAFVKMYGAKSVEDILHIRRIDFNKNKNDESSRKNMRKFIESGYQIYHAESFEQTKDGKWKWFSNQTIGVIENGRLNRIWGSQIDISDRKQTEMSLKQSEERYRSLMENLPVGVFRSTYEGKVISANPAMAEIYGYGSVEELLKLPAVEYYHPSNPREKLLSELLKNKYLLGWETLEHKKDGALIWVSTNYQANFDEKGKIKHLDGVIIDITAKKLAELKLSESQKQYEALFNQIADPVIVFEQETKKLLHCNTAMIEKYGYTLDKLKEMTPLSLHPKTADQTTILKNINDDEKFSPNEYLHQAKDGTIYLVETHTQDIVFEGKKSWITIIRDITERRVAEKASQESAEKYRVLYTSTTDAIFLIQDQKFVSCNPKTLEIYGCEKEEIIGLSPIDFSPKKQPNGKASATEALKKLNKALKGKPQAFEWLHLKKDGTPFNAEVTLTKMVLSDGEFVHAIVKDITERKRSELVQKTLYNISNTVITSDDVQDLISTIQEHLSNIIDTKNFYIGLYDKQTKAIKLPYVAGQFDEVDDFPAEKTMTGYVIETKKSLLVNATQQEEMVAQGVIDFVGTRSKIWLGVPLIINGEVQGAVVVQSYDDENAYDKSDMEILEFVSDQISLSIHRKNAEQNLKDALKKATESDRLKSTFLATMSHELRTPLNAIIGFSDIINKNMPVDEIVKFAETINTSGNHLLNIVEDLFDITLIESGQIKIFKEDFQLMSILNNVHEIAKAEQKRTYKESLKLDFIVPNDANNQIIHTDRSKLKQILINLLKNAFKFTSEGAISFGFATVNIGEKAYFRFFVKDTGIGVKEAQQKLIFEMFRQADETYTTAHEGTGIGLSITKKLTELLGGNIWIESEPEKGSTFFFTIPLNQDLKTKETTNSEAKAQGSIKSKTILIVEDVEASFELLKAMLKSTEANLLWAKNGEEALTMCEDNPKIDLILMDINMPIMNGYDATRLIKAKRPELPIIAQTAYAIIGDKEKSLDAGCDDYISKPIKKQHLLKLLLKHTTS